MLRPHIVILGAGFGGTYVAKDLVRAVRDGEIDVTIVNRTNYFLFTPLLHEVATGSLSPRSVAEPLREVFVNTGIKIVQGAVDSIDPTARIVAVKADGHLHKLSYDQLIIATGAETNYYGIPGAAELALPLKSLADAALIRNRVIDAFERAVLEEDESARRALLSFVVVGGGATGVEVAAELADWINGMVKRYYGGTHCRSYEDRKCTPEEPSVTLINAGKELLEMFAPGLRKSAADRLRSQGVTIMNEAAVASVGKVGIALKDGRAIPASVIIWAAGVKALVPHFEGALPTLSGGRLAVDGYFRLLGQERIFALGDVAAYIDAKDLAKGADKVRPLPMLAQVAEAEARLVSQNILATTRGKSLRDFHYRSKGSMVSVGQWFAIGEILAMKIAGRFAWWLWRTIYLSKFASWRKRIRIGFEWAFELISPRDITKM